MRALAVGGAAIEATHATPRRDLTLRVWRAADVAASAARRLGARRAHTETSGGHLRAPLSLRRMGLDGLVREVMTTIIHFEKWPVHAARPSQQRSQRCRTTFINTFV